MSDGIPSIVDARLVGYEDIGIKMYVLSGFPTDELDPSEVMKEGISQVYGILRNVGNLGIAFMYSYVNSEGRRIIGIDLTVYRLFSSDAPDLPLNPMEHTWTLELDMDNIYRERFRELDRSRDGTFCALEATLLGRDAALILALIRAKDPRLGESYLGIFPYLPPMEI